MNHFEIIVRDLKERESSLNLQVSHSYSILLHLIMLLGRESFNRKFEMYILNNLQSHSFDTAFAEFHKAMRQTDFFEIGDGHLDMVFYNYIHLSDKCYDVFKSYTLFITSRRDELNELEKNINKRVEKCSIGRQEENGKPFKSGQKINTVKNIIIHPILETFAYTFHEDDSYVECRRCKVIEEIK